LPGRDVNPQPEPRRKLIEICARLTFNDQPCDDSVIIGIILLLRGQDDEILEVLVEAALDVVVGSDEGIHLDDVGDLRGCKEHISC
jgi:hypothetical protein